jgi:hypothetical protein
MVLVGFGSKSRNNPSIMIAKVGILIEKVNKQSLNLFK